MKEVLAIDKNVYGNEHPYVATGLSNLASLYRAQASSPLIFGFFLGEKVPQKKSEIIVGVPTF